MDVSKSPFLLLPNVANSAHDTNSLYHMSGRIRENMRVKISPKMPSMAVTIVQDFSVSTSVNTLILAKIQNILNRSVCEEGAAIRRAARFRLGLLFEPPNPASET